MGELNYEVGDAVGTRLGSESHMVPASRGRRFSVPLIPCNIVL